jgi:hypothetical protein
MGLGMAACDVGSCDSGGATPGERGAGGGNTEPKAGSEADALSCVSAGFSDGNTSKDDVWPIVA